MRKLFLTILIFVSTSAISSAQTSVDIDGQFSSLVLKGAIRAEIIPSSTSRVSIILNGATPKRIRRTLEDGKLSIVYRLGALEKGDCIDVKIYCSDLTYIGVEGVSVVSDDPIESQLLKVETLGGSNHIDLRVNVRNLGLNIGGSGKSIIRGEVEELTVKANMGARIDCSECQAQRVSAIITQKSEVDVRVSSNLYAEVTMRSNLFYLGNPQYVETKKRTGGGIIAIETARK